MPVSPGGKRLSWQPALLLCFSAARALCLPCAGSGGGSQCWGSVPAPELDIAGKGSCHVWQDCGRKPGSTGGSKLRSSFLPARYRALSGYSAAEGWWLLLVWFGLVGFFYNRRNQNVTQVYRNRNRGSTPGPEDQLAGQPGFPSTLGPARLQAGCAGQPASAQRRHCCRQRSVLAKSPLLPFHRGPRPWSLQPPSCPAAPARIPPGTAVAEAFPFPCPKCFDSLWTRLAGSRTAPAPVSSAPALLSAWLLCSARANQAAARQGGGAGSGHGP